MARCGPRSKRTPTEIYTALEVVELCGLRGTSRITGIPLTTLHDWKEMEKEGMLDEFVNEKCSCDVSGDEPESENAPASELTTARQQSRTVFVARAMELSLTILQAMELKVSGANFKDLATSFGILLDKILLMTGNPTSRTETIRSVDREDLLKAAQEVSEKVKVLPKQGKSQQ